MPAPTSARHAHSPPLALPLASLGRLALQHQIDAIGTR